MTVQEKTLKAATKYAVEPFEINIPEATLADMREWLKKTRFPADFNNQDWEYGFNTGQLREYVDYWMRRFDWRAEEAKMNKFHHFKTEIDGAPIHFIHEKGKGPNPMPLILHHGFPWTYWDFNKVIGPLTDPAAYGGDPKDSFDVVLCSLPGHGFSSPLMKPGFNFWRTADLDVTLMKDILGYEKFAAEGGDWGALVVGALGHKYPKDLIGIYCHLPIQNSHYQAVHSDVPPGVKYSNGLPEESEFGPDEAGWFKQNVDFFNKESGYGYIQLTKPQTLGVALNDSPAGLFAYIIEKRRTWADTHGDIESRFSKDHLCATATIYWVTETITTAARFYKECIHNPWKASHSRWPQVEAPTALGVFTADVLLSPRSWSEKYYNLQQYRVHKSGGHFAPYEEPDTVIKDIRDFFQTLR
jgi:pimeloyl-ACP methyl ester carboxylesterase